MSSVVRYSAHLRSPVNHISSFWNNIYPGVDGGVGMSQSQPIDESRYQKDNVHVSVPLSLLGHEPDNPTGLYLSKPSMVRLKSQGHVLEETKTTVTGDDHWEDLRHRSRAPSVDRRTNRRLVILYFVSTSS